MTKEEFDELTKGATPMRDVHVRGIHGGFVVVGRARWMDNESGAQVLGQEMEAAATDATMAAALAGKWLTSGAF